MAREKKEFAQQIASLRSRALFLDEVVTATEHTSDADKTEPFADDATTLFAKHSEVLKEWSSHSLRLKAWAESEGKAIVNGDDDDDGKEEESFGCQLFAKQSQCLRIIAEQRSRLDVASTGQHLLELIDRQRTLSVCRAHSVFYQKLIKLCSFSGICEGDGVVVLLALRVID